MSRRWLALPLVSLVLLVIGIGVMLVGMSSKSDAESDRDKKSEQLVSQRRATREAEQEAEERRAQALEVADGADAVLNLSAQISQKDDEILRANQDAVNSFSNPNPSTFNAAVDRASTLVDEANALIDQANAAISALEAKVNALGQAGTSAS